MSKNFVTVGTFDGVHLGHACILRALSDEAKELGMKSLAAYFPIPPRAVLTDHKAQNLLTLPAEREALIKACGVDCAVPLEFSAALAKMKREDFFKTVLLGKLNAGGILAGQDFAFGHGREGHVHWLREACDKAGVALSVLNFVKECGHKISSSAIRELLRSGDVAAAAAMLGRNYAVRGTVVRGEGLGRKLGFPTANIDAGTQKIMPLGVFAVRARVAGSADTYTGVANVGFRPTVNTIHTGIPLCEVHLLDFSRDIYGKIMEVEFASKIRGELRFTGLEALVAAINSDINWVRKNIG
jgi:riboflavin kinase/FMN adenylyltransferase